MRPWDNHQGLATSGGAWATGGLQVGVEDRTPQGASSPVASASLKYSVSGPRAPGVGARSHGAFLVQEVFDKADHLGQCLGLVSQYTLSTACWEDLDKLLSHMFSHLPFQLQPLTVFFDALSHCPGQESMEISWQKHWQWVSRVMLKISSIAALTLV